MATFKQMSEEGRPPDPSTTNKHLNRKISTASSLPTWHSNSTKHLYHATTPSKTCSEFNNNAVFEVRAKFVQDLNQNVHETVKRPLMVTSICKSERSSLKQSLPKLLCLKKPPSAAQEGRNTFKTLNVNALRVEDISLTKRYLRVDEDSSVVVESSNIEKSGDEDPSSSRNGNYLPKNRNSFHQNVEEALSSLLWQPYEYQNSGNSLSLTSSSCTSPSSSSGDLDEITKNDGTPHRCSFTDLHLPTTTSPATSEMVVHLPDDQWVPGPRSRDPHPNRPTSWLSQVFSRTEVPDARAGPTDALDASDVQNSGDMQVNVSPGAPQGSGPSPETGPRSNVTVQNVFQSSLSSANVVGLPNHTRYASVPVSAVQNRPAAIIPSHARNVSEPSNQFAKYPNSNPQGNALRHSSQVDQSNLHQINHFRSSSVPKSMPIVPRHETGSTVTTTTTVPGPKIPQKFPAQMHNNVSNVNVNFYRAVPVNVVSSVPTIHCLNTLSNVQGNNVSNVQVLPLGSSFPQQQVYNFPVTTSVGFSNPSSSGVNGTTQVILHNTQANNTNSIQIPSNFQNVNNRSTLLCPQVVPVPAANNRSTVSTCTNTGSFLPPPPVTSSGQEVIQNTKPSTTVVPMVNVQPSGPRTYSNAAINTMPLNAPPLPPPNKPVTEPGRTPRTFTSTEAQTDEISVLPPVSEPLSGNREQRRRERRERRHQRRVNNSGHRHTVDGGAQVNDRLPDILNSHLPPPYSTLPAGMPPQSVMNSMVPPPPPLVPPHVMAPPPPHGAVLQTVVPNNVVPPSGFVFPAPPPPQMGQVPLVQGPAPVAVPVPPPSGFRFPFPANEFRRGRFAEDPPKGCCGLLSWKPGSLRWFIALIALVAVCCVLVGTALGAMRPAGRDHLTVSLLMIGVGIVLVTVSGVAWRLTSHDSSTCRSMLGLGSTESVDVCTRRFVPRLPPSYGRPHHPYAAMMYPEFQYRPPPPSYQASMQEYRLRLLLLDRGNTPQIQAGIQNAVSPPPTYRSHAGSLLRAPLSSRREAAQSEYSCPPSYRSQNSTNRPGTIQSNSVLHSREQSLSLSESNHGGSVVNVVNILGSTEEDIALDNITLDSLKMEPETELNPVKMLLKGSSSDLEGSKDGNLVTIVQTCDQSPVIVTVSGSSQIDSSSVQITEIPSEMEILAHL